MAQFEHIKGGAELQKFLETLPAKIERNIIRGALRAGATVIKQAAVANVPVGPTSSENAKAYGGYLGALRDTIRVSAKVRAGRVTASVIAGGKTKNGADVYYAQWVEYGTRPHTITVANAEGLSFGGHFYKSVEHPGAKPHPFMRRAFDTSARAAIPAIAEKVRSRLTKEGIDTSEAILEGDE